MQVRFSELILQGLDVVSGHPCYALVSCHILSCPSLQAKRKRARTPTPGEYLGVRGTSLQHSVFIAIVACNSYVCSDLLTSFSLVQPCTRTGEVAAVVGDIIGMAALISGILLNICLMLGNEGGHLGTRRIVRGIDPCLHSMLLIGGDSTACRLETQGVQVGLPFLPAAA